MSYVYVHVPIIRHSYRGDNMAIVTVAYGGVYIAIIHVMDGCHLMTTISVTFLGVFIAIIPVRYGGVHITIIRVMY
jgi:hypothetical protein